ncbi:hypothetical protein MWH28_09785 [Natroniella sulfidigena]|uniref:hypothetical protein n=1 Tax=Natroniella sulfidigena TaxID=723921 RepID=UPI00200A0A69|nr:hypothetical protein [Natroniella sulfidigena]MCK8817648.1 hypothetical protein [Natroniella sulfidigena]
MVRLKVCEVMYQDGEGNKVTELALKPLVFWDSWTEEEIRKFNFIRHHLGVPGEGSYNWSMENCISGRKLNLKVDQEVLITELYELVQKEMFDQSVAL